MARQTDPYLDVPSAPRTIAAHPRKMTPLEKNDEYPRCETKLGYDPRGWSRAGVRSKVSKQEPPLHAIPKETKKKKKNLKQTGYN